MSKFTKSYWQSYRKEKARQERRSAAQYTVIVYNSKEPFNAVPIEVQRFSTYEAAQSYVDYYNNGNTPLKAYIQ